MKARHCISSVLLVLTCTPGCQQPAGAQNLLVLTDTNIGTASGGAQEQVLQVANGEDLCVNASALGEGVATVGVGRMAASETELQCVLAKPTFSQSWFSGALWLDSPGTESVCLSAMESFPTDLTVSCEEGITWVALAYSLESIVLGWQILDPCAAGSTTEIHLQPSDLLVPPVTLSFDDSTPLIAEAEVAYVLDWTDISTNVLGEPVDIEDIRSVIIAQVAAEDDLAVVATTLGASAIQVWELGPVFNQTSAALQTTRTYYNDTAFPGFSVGTKWLVGLSEGSDCLPVDIIAQVHVQD